MIFEPVTGDTRRKCIWVLNQNAKKSFPSWFLTVLVDRNSVQAFFSHQEFVNLLYFFMDIKNSLLSEKQKTFSWEHMEFLNLGTFFSETFIYISIWYLMLIYWKLLVSVRLYYH